MSYPGDSALASDVQQRILTTFQQTLDLAIQGSKQEALLGCDFILRLDPQFGPARTLQQMVNAGRSGADLAGLFGGASVAPPPAGDSEADPYIQAFLESARQARAAGDSAEVDRLLRKARMLDASHPAIAKFESEGASASTELPELGEASFELPEVDFSTGGEESILGGAPGGGEGASRIRELLADGQKAFDRGEFQGAIDAWSRIFLIDIDHHEAARRIEEARRLKAEREREVEELFHGGVAQFDSADFANAERSFQRVLELSPGYVLAQEYLEKIAERSSGGPAIPPPASAAVGRSGGEAPAEASRAGARAPREKSQGEILVPPEPGAARGRSREERPGYGVAAKKKGGPSPRFLAIGGAVLVLLLAGGWLLLRNRASLFPNAKATAEAPPPSAAADPIARAKALHADGKTAIALAQLRRLPPQDPSYAEAQSLVSQWEALVQPAEPVPAALAPELRAKREALVTAAERACREGENLRCQRALERAAAIQPLDATLEAQLATAKRNLAPLESELKMFGEGEYEAALNRLWRLSEAEPGNRDARQLIVDSYFNLGVLELQRGDPAAAADRFREAREIDAADPEVERLESFSLTYTQRPEDLLFQIFVRNLTNR
jgi:tetratricopeptide (TPR) repeat protein